MRFNAKYFAVLLGIFCPAITQGQSVGQVECPRSGGYVYLYSSMTTLDVRTTLQCREQVQITGRYDVYFGVRTAKGDVGYVPVDSLLVVKEAEPRKRLGHGGKLAFSINTVRLRDNEEAAVRSFQESSGANNSAGGILSSKDVVFAQGTEFTAYVDGDMHLKKAAFQAEKDSSGTAPAPPNQKAPQPPGP